MESLLTVLLTATLTASAFAQESGFLELIDLHADPAKKTEVIGAYAHLQDEYNRLTRWTESLEVGAKLLAVNERDVETVRRNLIAARGLRDNALIQKWDGRLTELTREPEESVTASSSVNTPYVEEPVEIASTNGPVITTRMKANLEVSMFNNALRETDPKRRLELVQQFMAEYPDSIHANSAGYLRFVALRDLGDHNSAVAAAEAILTRDQTREDVLLYVAARYFNEKRELKRAMDLCHAVIDLVNSKPKPENVDDAAWSEHRYAVLFQSQWIIGLGQMQQNDWASADKSLRTTLTLAKAGDENIPGILNSLAWTNYRMKKIPEAIRLYSQCSASATHGAACKQSVAWIKNEYGLQ